MSLVLPRSVVVVDSTRNYRVAARTLTEAADKILEVGSSYGVTSELMARRCRGVIGVDKGQREVEEDEPSGEKPNGRRRGETKAAPAVPAEGNLDAERALVRVAAKLDGYEGAELRTVAGQVQQLLQDAQDPDLLCALYPGWAPWV